MAEFKRVITNFGNGVGNRNGFSLLTVFEGISANAGNSVIHHNGFDQVFILPPRRALMVIVLHGAGPADGQYVGSAGKRPGHIAVFVAAGAGIELLFPAAGAETVHIVMSCGIGNCPALATCTANIGCPASLRTGGILAVTHFDVFAVCMLQHYLELAIRAPPEYLCTQQICFACFQIAADAKVQASIIVILGRPVSIGMLDNTVSVIVAGGVEVIITGYIRCIAEPDIVILHGDYGFRGCQIQRLRQHHADITGNTVLVPRGIRKGSCNSALAVTAAIELGIFSIITPCADVIQHFLVAGRPTDVVGHLRVYGRNAELRNQILVLVYFTGISQAQRNLRIFQRYCFGNSYGKFLVFAVYLMGDSELIGHVRFHIHLDQVVALARPHIIAHKNRFRTAQTKAKVIAGEPHGVGSGLFRCKQQYRRLLAFQRYIARLIQRQGIVALHNIDYAADGNIPCGQGNLTGTLSYALDPSTACPVTVHSRYRRVAGGPHGIIRQNGSGGSADKQRSVIVHMPIPLRRIQRHLVRGHHGAFRNTYISAAACNAVVIQPDGQGIPLAQRYNVTVQAINIPAFGGSIHKNIQAAAIGGVDHIGAVSRGGKGVVHRFAGAHFVAPCFSI